MCLINGTSIARMPIETVTYWHVELDQHDVILAEGLPVESYFDMGTKPWFKGDDSALSDPDLIPLGIAGRCLPVAVSGSVVERGRQKLNDLFAFQLDAQSAWSAVDLSTSC